MLHVFPILMPWADASRRVYSALARFVRKRLETGVLGGIEAGGGAAPVEDDAVSSFPPPPCAAGEPRACRRDTRPPPWCGR